MPRKSHYSKVFKKDAVNLLVNKKMNVVKASKKFGVTRQTLSRWVREIDGSKENINKRKSFVRLANSRVNNLIKSIQILGNLSKKSYYDYKESDLKKIFTTLRNQLDNTEKLFQGKQEFEEFSIE